MKKGLLAHLLTPLTCRVARQLAHPRGWFGRVFVTRALNRRNRELISATLAHLDLREDTRLLDVGFGGGLSLQLAAEKGVRRLAGVDPSQAAVQQLRDHPPRCLRETDLRVVQGSAEDLPFDASSFDAIISTNTIYFWPELGRPLAELFRVLAPGGRLAIGFSGPDKLRELGAVTRHGFLLHDESAVVLHAQRAGYADAAVVELRGGDNEGSRVLVATKRE